MLTGPLETKITPFAVTRSRSRVALALTSRLLLFALFQASIAAFFAINGEPGAWRASVAWWPLVATVTNFVSIGLVRHFLAQEGGSYRQLLHVERGTLATDLLVTLGLLIVGGALAMIGNVGLAMLLWSDPQVALDTFIQPLPVWAAVVGMVGFPLSIALSELPTYYGYVRPRLEELGAVPWLALSLTAAVHSLQHLALPLVLDWRFLLWRGLMFLPFALFVAASLRWRPRLLPILMIAHGLLDLSVGVMVLQAALGS